MKITENLYLENSGQYFRVVEKGMSNPKKAKDGEVQKLPEEINISVREFGTVYQALIHIIESDYDVNGDLLVIFQTLIQCIDEAKEDIKRNFRIEVKTT